MVNPNPQGNEQETRSSTQTESQQSHSRIGTSFFEIENHSQELISSFESEISNNQNLSQKAQRELLEEVNTSMLTTITRISHEINQSGEILNERQEFIYICEQMHRRYDGISTQTISIALGQYIAINEPSRYQQVSEYLETQQIDTSRMLISAIRSSRRRNLDNIAIDLISLNHEIPEQYIPEIQEQTLEIIQTNPEALRRDISHIFEGNEDLLVDNLDTSELFSVNLNLFLNLRIIETIIEKKLKQLQESTDPKHIIEEINIINNCNNELASLVAERITETKSDILEQYISRQFRKANPEHSAEILYLVSRFCNHFPKFIFDELAFLLNDNIDINHDLLDYFLKYLFQEKNFDSCNFFIENLQAMDEESETFEIFIKNIYIENFHSLALFHNLSRNHKLISLKILLKSYNKSQKNIFLYQVKLILESYATSTPYNQQESREIIELISEFPDLTSLMKNEIKNILVKGFYLIPLNVISIEKSAASKYAFLINQINIISLNVPSLVARNQLPTDYIKVCMDNLGNFKNKFQLSTEKMLQLVEYLKKIQIEIDPDTDFSIYEDEISQIYN